MQCHTSPCSPLAKPKPPPLPELSDPFILCSPNALLPSIRLIFWKDWTCFCQSWTTKQTQTGDSLNETISEAEKFVKLFQLQNLFFCKWSEWSRVENQETGPGFLGSVAVGDSHCSHFLVWFFEKYFLKYFQNNSRLTSLSTVPERGPGFLATPGSLATCVYITFRWLLTVTT